MKRVFKAAVAVTPVFLLALTGAAQVCFNEEAMGNYDSPEAQAAAERG